MQKSYSRRRTWQWPSAGSHGGLVLQSLRQPQHYWPLWPPASAQLLPTCCCTTWQHRGAAVSPVLLQPTMIPTRLSRTHLYLTKVCVTPGKCRCHIPVLPRWNCLTSLRTIRKASRPMRWRSGDRSASASSLAGLQRLRYGLATPPPLPCQWLVVHRKLLQRANGKSGSDVERE